jgi:hypothetical protein
MKVHEYNEMMAYLLRPRQKFAIGGGVVEGEDLGSREGFFRPAKKSLMVEQYLTNLPKNSEVSALDLSEQLNVNRKLIDNALKQKNFKNKFKIVERAGILSMEDFPKEYKKYQESDFFKTGKDSEFADYLNDKKFKSSGNKEWTADSVKSRRLRLNIENVNPLQLKLSDKDILKEAKRFNIDTKNLNPDQLRGIVLGRRARENLSKRMAEDPELDQRIRSEASERAKKRYQELRKTEEGRTIIRDIRRKSQQKEYLLKGIDPQARTADEAIFRDAVSTSRKNIDGKGRFSIDSGLKKSMTAKDYFSNKIKIKDNITNKTFTYNTFKNYVNKNAKSFGIKNYAEALKPYSQKFFINETPNLRNNINSVLIPGWTGGDPRTAFTVQHDFGRQQNPLKTSLAFYDDNLKEYNIRKDFENSWEKSKTSKTPLIEKKKAFNVFKEDLAKLNIQSVPSMVERNRFFGEGLDLTKAIRMAKDAGAKIPKGTFKKASEFDQSLVSANPFLDPRAILTGLGDVAKVLGTPSVAATFAGTTIKENLDKGDSFLDAATDKMVGIDLLYPELAKQTVGKLAPRGTGILSTLGRFAANPFGRAARAFTPIGAGITAIGLGKDYYDFVQSDLAKKAADPEAYAAEQEEQMGMSA